MSETSRTALSFDLYQSNLANLKNEADRDRVQWLWGYFHNVLNKSKEAIATELGVSWDDICAFFHTRFNLSTARYSEICDAVDALIRRVRKQKPLVHTIVAERIIEALDYSRDYSAMVYISGPTGRGKTYTAEYWAERNNHGRSKFIRVPSDCSRRTLVLLLCRASGVSVRGSTADMELNLHKALGPRNVLIIDEAGHLLSKSGRPGGAIELMRDLHDITRCGVALIFTDVYLAEIKRGRNADYFEQFLGRLEFPVEIPKVPRRDEVRQVLSAFYDDVDEELVSYAHAQTTGRDGKLRTLFKDLYRAEEFARDKGRKITKNDLQNFVKWRKSGGAWPEDK
ncbi:MAG: AAA family ATPase [Victivallales bacterium]